MARYEQAEKTVANRKVTLKQLTDAHQTKHADYLRDKVRGEPSPSRVTAVCA